MMVNADLQKQVIIAEDSPVSRMLLQRSLNKWGFDVTVTHDGKQAYEALSAENSARLAILDWMMPGMDGVEVCRKIRQLSHLPYTYIVMLTSMTNKGDLAEALQAGADDFVSKPFNEQELKARLRAGQRILELQGALEFQARHDALTGVLNRRAVIERLEQELSRAYRKQTPMAVALIDVDHFKGVNDRFGHLVGDEALRAIVKRIGGMLRPYDAIGRYGGEEYLVILPDCNLHHAQEIAERLRIAVAVCPVDLRAVTLPLTVSIGIAVTNGNSLQQPDELFHLADEAVYQAKKTGRNCIRVAANSAEGEEARSQESGVRINRESALRRLPAPFDLRSSVS